MINYCGLEYNSISPLILVYVITGSIARLKGEWRYALLLAC
jgi:hypothetical protein